MKRNYKSVLSQLSEYIILIAPTAGYAIYCYADTLQYTMSSTSKGAFWTLISLSILAAVIYRIFKTKYDRYVDGFVQQKTDLETNPTNELLIKKVAEKKTIIENLDYVVAAIPLLILISVLYAFQESIDQLVIILEIVLASIVGKVGLHALNINLLKKDMLASINKDGE